MKLHSNITKQGITELVLTRKVCSGMVWGANLIVDPKAKS